MAKEYHSTDFFQGSDFVKELYIDRGITQSRAAIFNNGKLLDLYIENVDCTSINGNIYMGRIENIVNSLNAAFVNIGIKKNAILHFESEEKLKELKKGQDIIVQVIREGIGEKGPRVSEQLSIPGKYIVLLPGDNYIGVSKKIDNFDIRNKIKDAMFKVHEEGYGVIVRTESRDIPFDELCNDYIVIKDIWKEIERKIIYMKSPQLLFNSKDFYEFIIREYIKNDIDKIYLNREVDIEIFKEKLVKVDKSFNKKIIYDEYNFTMQDKIEKEIERAKERKISLDCGGYIVIDHTEAFTCIDVNSGNCTLNQNSEDMILNVNLEACSKISSAVKLRNISGIILIDFIDMKSEENKNIVLSLFENEFLDDKSKMIVYGFTKLGILETARAKKGIRIMEFIYSDLENKLISPSYCLKLIENKCIKAFKHYKKNNFKIYVSQIIFDEMYSKISTFIEDMKSIYGINLDINKSDMVKDYAIGNDGNKVDNNIHM